MDTGAGANMAYIGGGAYGIATSALHAEAKACLHAMHWALDQHLTSCRVIPLPILMSFGPLMQFKKQRIISLVVWSSKFLVITLQLQTH